MFHKRAKLASGALWTRTVQLMCENANVELVSIPYYFLGKSALTATLAQKETRKSD